MKNGTPMLLCVIGGILLFIANYSHGVNLIVLLYTFLHAITALSDFYIIIDFILFILFIIAWSGGIAVIVGGVFLTTSHVRLGKFIIAVAAGFGIISFIIVIVWVYLVNGLVGLLVLTDLILKSAWAIGLILTIIARTTAK